MLLLSSYNGATLNHVTGNFFAVVYPDGEQSLLCSTKSGVKLTSGRKLSKAVEGWTRFTVNDVSTPQQLLNGRTIPEYHDDWVDKHNPLPNLPVQNVADRYYNTFGMH